MLLFSHFLSFIFPAHDYNRLMPAGCFLPRLIRYHRVLYFLLILTKAEQFCFLNRFISIGTTDQEVAICNPTDFLFFKIESNIFFTWNMSHLSKMRMTLCFRKVPEFEGQQIGMGTADRKCIPLCLWLSLETWILWGWKRE